jgi:hypothetical protein
MLAAHTRRRLRNDLRCVAWYATATSCCALAVWGCTPEEGCLGGDDGSCVPASACQKVEFQCAAAEISIRRIESGTERPTGAKALGGTGDILLANSRVAAVLDDLSSSHMFAPSGGTLLDLSPAHFAGTDHLNQGFQALGILSADAARYQRVELIDESPHFVAAVFRGKADGRPEMQIVTRYELRPCEPGLRVRTEIYHAGRDPITVFPADAFVWGGRSVTPFIPLRGQGFRQAELHIEELSEAFRDARFVAGDPHTEPNAAYAVVPCDRRLLSGFHSTMLSAVGPPRSVLMPGDSIAFERFVIVAPGQGQAPAVNAALDVRAQLFGERYSTVQGKVVDDSGQPVGGNERAASLLFYEPAPGNNPDAISERTPWAQAVPDENGDFEVRLPKDRDFRTEVHVLGRPTHNRYAFATNTEKLSLGQLPVPRAGTLSAKVMRSDGTPLVAELVLIPAVPTVPEDVNGSVFGEFSHSECAPYLGPPHGASPACNRVLVPPSGAVSFDVPPGSYFVYATHGPFWSLTRERVTLAAHERRELVFVLAPLPLLKPGTLSADFHVHGAASFDSSLPDRDRALSFVATGVDVVAATDHDVITNYEAALHALGLERDVFVMPGVETTGQILFLKPPGSTVPRVVGHYNFWPLRYDPTQRRNGAIDDERLEPGALFDRMQSLMLGRGVIQLNHPYGDAMLGRDSGYLRAIGYDPRRAIPSTADASAEGQFMRRPAGNRSNLDFDTQEVMNGASIEQFLRYRTAWFSFLNQGILRAGTANSDSHTLAIEVLGYPRNLVLGNHSLQGFDMQRFNDSVRNGEMIGTNGPVLTTCISYDSQCRGPSLTAFSPLPNAELFVEVKAAPWIPLEEVRIYANGRLIQRIRINATVADDPFSTEESTLLRHRQLLDLERLLNEAGLFGDAWIVVEAGMSLPRAADLDNDGLVETTDNNGDGEINLADQVGTLSEPGPAELRDPRFHIQAVAPGVLPTSFSNPFLLDRDGDGFTPPGLE